MRSFLCFMDLLWTRTRTTALLGIGATSGLSLPLPRTMNLGILQEAPAASLEAQTTSCSCMLKLSIYGLASARDGLKRVWYTIQKQMRHRLRLPTKMTASIILKDIPTELPMAPCCA